MKKLIFVIIIPVTLYFSVQFAKITGSTDFPAVYRTATMIADPNTPNTEIYTYNPDANRYDKPYKFLEYRYSMLIAYLMAPLAYLPYNIAKGVMIYVDVLAYLGAVSLCLRLLGASGRWFVYPLALSTLWPPFICEVRYAQVNSIMFFLVAAGVYFATNKRPGLGGALIGFACLFKIFPIAVALILGIKNWRIMAGAAVVIGLALLLPGTPEWINSFFNQPFVSTLYSPILKLTGYTWFIVFAACIAGAAAFIAYRHREAEYITLTALAITAMLLTMPIMEYHYYTFLVLPICYLLSVISPQESSSA